MLTKCDKQLQNALSVYLSIKLSSYCRHYAICGLANTPEQAGWCCYMHTIVSNYHVILRDWVTWSRDHLSYLLATTFQLLRLPTPSIEDVKWPPYMGTSFKWSLVSRRWMLNAFICKYFVDVCWEDFSYYGTMLILTLTNKISVFSQVKLIQRWSDGRIDFNNEISLLVKISLFSWNDLISWFGKFNLYRLIWIVWVNKCSLCFPSSRFVLYTAWGYTYQCLLKQ